MKVLSSIKNLFGKHSDIIFVIGIMGILMVLFTPIPAMLLDILIIINISIALLILLLTFYVDKPIRFSTFPSILLIATLFRLSLNIASTRLILDQGDAGQVIGAIGEYVISGNYVIGLIVFVVLIVVQFVVVTNGAQRVAEVAARFTLDSMPGKQMAIDADLNMGVIDEKQAQARRKEIEKESGFYGSMDGASKFVKGDAIAGIIIVIINIVGGLTIGIAQLGLGWGEALNTYTLLTVGDGIVTQIPALVISTATGIIVTRSSSDAFLSKEIQSQFTAQPKILFIVATTLLVMLFLPGIPKIPVIVISMILFTVGYFSYKKKNKINEEHPEDSSINSNEDENDPLAWIDVHEFSIHLGSEVYAALQNQSALYIKKIESLREKLGMSYGVIIPDIKLIEAKSIDKTAYQIQIHGVQVAQGEIMFGKSLAIDLGVKNKITDGVKTTDPTYNLPAIWINDQKISEAKKSGYKIVDASTVLFTHLNEITEQKLADLFGLSQMDLLLDRMRKRSEEMLQDVLTQKVSKAILHQILKKLILQKVSIRRIDPIIQTLSQFDKVTGENIDMAINLIRINLSNNIIQNLLNNEQALEIKVLAPELERQIINSLQNNKISLPPADAEKLIREIVKFHKLRQSQSQESIIVTAPEVRSVFWEYCSRFVPGIHILSMGEIGATTNVQSLGTLKI
ncbi:MAG: FHIPEP family type III secretion protein [Saccharospirillaceae bacterium]|nr:flagellar biosynthesis protein FlhA [Pseudomonadales bacterium]NRB79745.1 FHIPEP family type III secretion protein [Saccharospirillaceae bacterium]